MEQLSSLIPQYLLDEVASRDSVQVDAAATSLTPHTVAINSTTIDSAANAESSPDQEVFPVTYQSVTYQSGISESGNAHIGNTNSGDSSYSTQSSYSDDGVDNLYDESESYGRGSELVVFDRSEQNSPETTGNDYSSVECSNPNETEGSSNQRNTPAEYSYAESARGEQVTAESREGFNIVDPAVDLTVNLNNGLTERELTERFSSGWLEAKSRLQSAVDPGLFLAWLKPLVFLKVGPKISNGHETYEVVLGAPNRFSTEHVTRRYSSLIIEHLSAASGFVSSEVSLRVGVGRGDPARQGEQKHQSLNSSNSNSSEHLSQTPSSGAELNREASSSIASSSAELKRISAPHRAGSSRAGSSRAGSSRAGSTDRSDSIQANECGLNPKYNFSNFVVGGCNQFAHAVCLRVSEDLGGNYNPLFIYGGVGLGKTHLANAIGNASRRRGKRVLLVSSELFVSELISALRSNKMQAFKNRFRSLDLLIVDDIQFIIGKERTQEEFFHTFNELHQKHKQIVMTSDKMPQDLIGLEERLKTRFASGISADLQAPDFETRVAILIRKSEQSSIQLPVEVARLLAERIDTNVRELEGALNRIQAFSSLYHEPITVDLAQSVLKTVAPEKSREVSPEQIQRIVGERFSIGLSDIIGKRRTQNIALARQVAMYLCRKLTPSSYPEIGALFGGRDHSTVIHANKVIEERIRTDEEFGRDIQAIERRLRGQ